MCPGLRLEAVLAGPPAPGLRLEAVSAGPPAPWWCRLQGPRATFTSVPGSSKMATGGLVFWYLSVRSSLPLPVSLYLVAAGDVYLDCSEGLRSQPASVSVLFTSVMLSIIQRNRWHFIKLGL